MKQFLLIGYGGEYILHELFLLLKSRKHVCHEINMADPNWRNYIYNINPDQPLTLLTSHHPFLDRSAFRLHHRLDVDIESIYFFIRKLNITESYWFPHDLIDMIREDEFGFLPNFKFIFLPHPNDELIKRVSKITSVGFFGLIKNITPKKLKIVNKDKIIFLPSEISFYGRNPDIFLKRFEALFKICVDFKVLEYPGSEILEGIAASYGCFVHNANTPAIDLINASDLVITCGGSSIIAESSSVTNTICLADDIFSREYQHKILNNYPNVKLLDISEAINYINSKLFKNNSLADNFPTQVNHPDIEKIYDILIS